MPSRQMVSSDQLGDCSGKRDGNSTGSEDVGL